MSATNRINDLFFDALDLPVGERVGPYLLEQSRGGSVGGARE